MASSGSPPEQDTALGLPENLAFRRFSSAKKKFSIVEFTAAQRMLAAKVLGKWHNLVDEAHSQLAKEIPRKQDMMFQMRQIPKTGVIYATTRAKENGYTEEAEDWANMGQGAPECGELPGQPKRPETVDFDVFHQEYAPVQGMPELRDAVAEHYNALYRKGKASKYTKDNVCIIPGGRGGLSRVIACLGDINVGYGVPDYTAYEELLGNSRSINPIPMPKDDGEIAISPERLRKHINQLGLGGVLVSNPCNPTGYLIEGEELQAWVQTSRELDCLLMMDEFYSHYIYTDDEENGKTVSSAEYVEDVNVDPLIIIDGLTKNWRCPGWRICWLVGPKEMMSTISNAASYMDGGAAHPLQKAAIPLIRDLGFVKQDIVALQKHFRMKRDLFLTGIEKLGITVDMVPEGTFYVWGNLSNLPHPVNDGITFFEECIKEKMICVPGIFFDINPGKRRHYTSSPYACYVRFSYGPMVKNLELGLKSIERVINKFKK